MKTLNNNNRLTDEDLVKAIVSTNDTLLFETLYDRYATLVFNKCYGFAKDEDEAKDLTQDVFLKLFVKLASFKGTAKFSTWLYAFTYNHCVNYVTRNTAKKIEKQSVDYTDIEDLSDVEDESNFLTMKVDKLQAALELIPPDDKMILLLKYQDFLSVKDIESVLGIGESAVKMRLKRAKDKLIAVYNEMYN
ncbi:RNA polymerase sigma factor [Mariniflexile maritimum]|uniref:RNA polymerase sigma factor n=1 Tax=Mariniflexile maritimum TaxID=2682493 RepID=UPI0012F6C86C|nr:sigma-70 family RNA polymerase sigma factor [Mariniflexile maritimum]MCB0450264.1 sigma-70 family RNA polymerase sigma factor [Confluentibacter sp.]HMQ43226.1 sigma-70 family RNA polymerase sigma factor [Mariniflexile sp.]HMR16076.1 sigma-70 family RNA polymerase sigma factor [Mariniflexile sp.]